MTLNERIEQLEKEVLQLTAKLKDLTQNTESKFNKPVSLVGGIRDRSSIRPIDQTSGLNQNLGGAVIWNSSEINVTPEDGEPVNPETSAGAKGYNKHSHGRFSGGALLADNLEIVQYDFVVTPVTNKNSQAYWNPKPLIKKMMTADKSKLVEMIGKLDLVFSPEKGMWSVSSYEIDVKNCYLVERDKDGLIVLDSKGQEKKSTLYNDDTTKSSVIWDENGNCWRFFAIYAPESPTPIP